MPRTNENIYELINALRLELKGDIAASGAAIASEVGKLDKRFDDMEEKRIKPIEEAVEKLRIDSATGNVKLGTIIFIASSVVSSIITIIMSKVIK